MGWGSLLCLYASLGRFCKSPTTTPRTMLSLFEACVLSLGSFAGMGVSIHGSTLRGEMWQHKLHHAFIWIVVFLCVLSLMGDATGFLFAGASGIMVGAGCLSIAALLLNHPAHYNVEGVGHHAVACSLIGMAVGAIGSSQEPFVQQGSLVFLYFMSLAGAGLGCLHIFLTHTRTDDGPMDTMMFYLNFSVCALVLLAIFILRLSIHYAKEARRTHCPQQSPAPGVKPIAYGIV